MSTRITVYPSIDTDTIVCYLKIWDRDKFFSQKNLSKREFEYIKEPDFKYRGAGYYYNNVLNSWSYETTEKKPNMDRGDE